MLNKKYRLDSKKIPAVARYGKRSDNNYFIIKFLKDEKLQEPKFAISISTKTSKNAVNRNKIKRKLRANLRKIMLELEVSPGFFLIIIKNEELKNMNDETIYNLICNSLKIFNAI